MTPQPDRELMRRQRLARLREVLRDADCAGAVLFDPLNIRYATDVTNMQVWCLHNPVRYAFVATEGPVVLFEFPSCRHLAEGVATVDEIRPALSGVYLMTGRDGAQTAPAWAAEVADLVATHGGGNRRLAVDRLEWPGYLALDAHRVEVLEGQPLLEQARMLKSDQEILAMRDAVATCEAGIQRMRNALEPGITEQALWAELHAHNAASGGEWIETRLLAAGPRTNPWYQEASDRPIRAGELVAFDTDLIGRHGMCCDLSRTWICGDGPPNERQRKTYRQAFALLQRQLDVLKPGITLEQLAQACGDPPDDYRVYTCLSHGVGLCDEYPVAFWRTYAERYDALLQPGMALCVESYAGPRDGGEGVKLEEQVLLTDQGFERLSSYPFEDAWL